MCSNCDQPCENQEHRAAQKGRFALSRTKPKRLWDLKPSVMCSLIGTCLSLDELKKLKRRKKIEFSQGPVSDYQLHGYFVSAATKDRGISTAMQSLLERKYRLTWKQFAQAQSAEELREKWDQEMAKGHIAGPYWAVLAHPVLTAELEDHVFGEVHMLSHLVGAANRADIKAMRLSETELKSLREELEQARCDIWSRDRIIAGLRTDLDHERRVAASRNIRENSSLDATAEGLRAALVEADKLNQGLQDAVARKARRVELLEQERERLKQELAHMEAESQALETALPTMAGQVCDADGGICPGEDACPFDLCHQRILYVGGRATLVGRYRDVVEQWNGEFLHHDGGLEQSFERLGGMLEQADIVVFPADCVSHAAVNHIKNQCRQADKRMLAVRSSGIGSFVTGLQSVAGNGARMN